MYAYIYYTCVCVCVCVYAGSVAQTLRLEVNIVVKLVSSKGSSKASNSVAGSVPMAPLAELPAYGGIRQHTSAYACRRWPLWRSC